MEQPYTNLTSVESYYVANIEASKSYFANNLTTDTQHNLKCIKYYCKSFGQGFKSMGLKKENVIPLLKGSYSQLYVSNVLRLSKSVQITNKQWTDWILEGID